MATVPVGVPLGFAGWTVLPLAGTAGVYRGSRILTGRATIRDGRADAAKGSALSAARIEATGATVVAAA